jgi:hypothetical protein
MRMPGEGLRRCHRQLVDRLAHLARDELAGRRPLGHDPRGFLDALAARLAEACRLGPGADRVALAWASPGNALAIAPHPTRQVDNVRRVANGASTLGDLLALPGEAVVFWTSRFSVLLHLCQMRCRLGGTPWPTLCRLAGGGMAMLWGWVERCFRRHDDLGGSPLFGSPGAATALLSAGCTGQRSGE